MKDELPSDTPTTYRPISMLDEADKWIIACRLIQYLDRVDLRVVRLTIDAIHAPRRNLLEMWYRDGNGVVGHRQGAQRLAVGFRRRGTDVPCAFVAEPLCRGLYAYTHLARRCLNRSCKHCLRLGVTGRSPPGANVISYTDDTLVTARGDTWI